MRLPLITVLITLPFSLSAESASIDAREYFGTYLFEDGVRVSGGRFDESGQQMLLYMDTENGRRGVPLIGDGPGFVPAMDLPDPVRVTFTADGSSMRWVQASGETLHARRVLKPGFRDAEFSNGDVVLRGTLYLPPDSKRPLPAIVLAHGSGPATRFAGTWTTFFLEQGLAVLAYDKRGAGESGGDWKTSTYLDLAADLDAAVSWLASQPEIDGQRIGLHASSQSGWYAPRTALMNDTVAFLIQRAAPAVRTDAGTAHEIREEWRAEGVPDEAIEPAVALWRDLHRMARERESLDAANDRLRAARGQPWFAATFGEWSEVSPDWWRRQAQNMQLDPAGDAARLKIPVLWFLAEEDENVPYRQSLNALTAVRERNEQLKIVTVDDANHGFLVTNAGGGVQYTAQYWPAMAEWLRDTSIVQ